jgi:hypothetical protein
MVMRILLGVENKKGALGALVVCAWRGENSILDSLLMDVTDHGASNSDRDGGERGSGRYGVPWCQY